MRFNCPSFKHLNLGVLIWFFIFPCHATELLDNIVVIETDKKNGSGFLLQENGETFLYTNQHVILGSSSIKAWTATGKQLILGNEVFLPHDDRDIIRINLKPHSDKSAPTISKNQDFRNGLMLAKKIELDSEVINYGNAEGERVVRMKKGTLVGIGPNKIEFTNPIVSGDSGSPVLDITNKVVGVATYATRNPSIWIADRPDLVIRRYGTRIDNIKWSSTTMKQWMRISLIFNKLQDITGEWYKEYISIWGKEGSFVEDYYQNKYSLPIYNSIVKRRYDLETVTQDSASSDSEELILSTHMEQWRADYDLFTAIMFPEDHAHSLVRTVFYDNATNVVQEEAVNYKFLPVSFYKSEIQVEIQTLKQDLDKTFKRNELRYNESIDMFANRKLLLTSPKTGNLSLSSKCSIQDKFWYFYFRDHQLRNLNDQKSLVWNLIPSTFLWIEQNWKKAVDLEKSPTGWATKALVNAKERYQLVNASSDRKYWKEEYNQKLRNKIIDTTKSGEEIRTFLKKTARPLRPYMTYRAFEIYNDLKSKLMEEMYQNILNEEDFEGKLKMLCHILECFGPKEEYAFYSQMYRL